MTTTKKFKPPHSSCSGGESNLLLDFLPSLFSKVPEDEELQSIVDEAVLKVRKEKEIKSQEGK